MGAAAVERAQRRARRCSCRRSGSDGRVLEGARWIRRRSFALVERRLPKKLRERLKQLWVLEELLLELRGLVEVG